MSHLLLSLDCEIDSDGLAFGIDWFEIECGVDSIELASGIDWFKLACGIVLIGLAKCFFDLCCCESLGTVKEEIVVVINC